MRSLQRKDSLPQMSTPGSQEMMIVAAARALAGARTVLVGVGLPNLACNLARRTVAPELELIYESGAFGARPARQPLSIGDPALVSGARMVASMADLFLFYLQGGRVDVAMLGAAQIDPYGNLNTTVIGDYLSPRVRLPGSGGACEIASNAGRYIVITPLSKRTFVEKLDFRSSPGFLDGPGGRERLGLLGSGPTQVITDQATFGFEPSTREMVLESLYPGVEVSQIQEQVGWSLGVDRELHRLEPPTNAELQILRAELDPEQRDR